MESIGSADGQQQSCWIPKLILMIERVVGATGQSPLHRSVSWPIAPAARHPSADFDQPFGELSVNPRTTYPTDQGKDPPPCTL